MNFKISKMVYFKSRQNLETVSLSRIASEKLVNYDGASIYPGTMTKIVIFLTIRHSMSHICLGNSEETLEYLFEATFGELIFITQAH